MPSRAAGLAGVLVLVLLTGCGDDGRDLPDASEFPAGQCRQAAPTVLAVDESVRGLQQDSGDVAAALTSLQADQSRLQELLADGGEVGDQLQDVVARVGFARAALATDSVDDGDIDAVTAAVDRFVGACLPEESR